ncbi:MAG: helix-turn-helix domain-containing protein [Bacteroidia bacterium]
MSRFAIFFFKTPSNAAIAGADAADLGMLLRLFYREFSRPSYPEKAEVLKAYLRIIRVKSEHFQTGPSETNATEEYKFFEKYIIMLEREVFRVRKIEYYSNRIGITTRKLSAICRQYGSKSAKELIDERLISEAKRRLRQSSCSIKEIALQIGFSDQYQFSKYFKKHVKVSPVNYRNKS